MSIDNAERPPDGVPERPQEERAAEADSSAARRSAVLGSVLLFLGLGLLTLLLVDRELPLAMPRSWYTDRSLWVAGGLIALASGWYLLRDSTSGAATVPDGPRDPARRKWDAGVRELGAAGPRFSRLVLYTCRRLPSLRGGTSHAREVRGLAAPHFGGRHRRRSHSRRAVYDLCAGRRIRRQGAVSRAGQRPAPKAADRGHPATGYHPAGPRLIICNGPTHQAGREWPASTNCSRRLVRFLLSRAIERRSKRSSRDARS